MRWPRWLFICRDYENREKNARPPVIASAFRVLRIGVAVGDSRLSNSGAATNSLGCCFSLGSYHTVKVFKAARKETDHETQRKPDVT